MKRGTLNHVKVDSLMDLLGRDRPGAGGVLEAIWAFTSEYAPAGDIGKFTDAQIARRIGYEGDPKQLMEALHEAHWVDASEAHRYVIHDWPDHCEDGVHKKLARETRFFADGSRPSMSRIDKRERKKIEAAYRDHNPALNNDVATKRPTDAQRTPEVRPTDARRTPLPDPALPDPALPSPAKPNPAQPATAKLTKPAKADPALGRSAAGPGAGACATTGAGQRKRLPSAFADLTPAMLADNDRLLAWFKRASSKAKPVINGSEQSRRRVFEAAECALAEHRSGECTEPVGLFGWIVGQRKWDRITAEHENAGRKRLRMMLGTPPPREPTRSSDHGGPESVKESLQRMADQEARARNGSEHGTPQPRPSGPRSRDPDGPTSGGQGGGA